MFRRILVATAVAGTLVAGLAIAPAASARDVAWSVSIGAPGVAVTAGAPGYWGPYYRPYPYYPPYWRSAYVSPPVYYAPRVVYASPYVVARPAYRYYGPYGY